MSVALDVGIVGGGVMGLSLARALARSGAGVTLVTAGALGSGGASEVPAALLNPFRGRSGRAHPDDLAALDVAWAWAAELRAEGLDPGAVRSGVVRVADGPKQARAFQAVAGLRPFDPGQAPAPYRAPHGGAYGAAGGWLDPRRWTAALAASAITAGARLRAHAPVAAIETAAHGRWRLLGEDGSTSCHDRLLLATGAAHWPAAWSRALPQPTFERSAGDVVVGDLAAPALPLAGGVYLAPATAPSGLVAAVGGHHRPPGAPAAGTAAQLARALAWAWPALADIGPDPRVWWGVRAHASGNRPQLTELAPGAWWVGALAGRGFLVAAAWAETVARQLGR